MASRTLPGLGLKGDWALGEDNWKAEMDTNLLTLSIMVQARVLDTLTVLPAGVEGAVYLCAADHATQPNKIAAYDEGAWVYYAPFEGLEVYDVAANTKKRFDGATWGALGGNPYRLGFSIETSVPGNSEVLLRHVFTSAVTFADDFAGSRGRLRPGGANPGSAQAFSILHNGVAVGTMSISTAGVVTFTTAAGALACAIGDELRVDAPAAPDANILGVSCTLLGSES